MIKPNRPGLPSLLIRREQISMKLPYRHVLPSTYELSLTPSLSSSSASGSMKLLFTFDDSVEDSDKIFLHSRGIKIDEASVKLTNALE